MKKFIFKVIYLSASAIALQMPFAVMAALPCPSGVPACAIPTGVDAITILENIANAVFIIFIVVSAMFFVIAGYMFVVAMGEPAKLDKAKHMVLYGLIGTIVAFAAKALVWMVKTVVVG